MAAKNHKLNVLFIPFFAPSHIIPMVDIAKLFAARGVSGTIITTPHNSTLFRDSLNTDASPGNEISVHTLKFPAAEAGLPAGIENFGQTRTTEMMMKLGHAVMLLRKPMEEFIRDSRPDCIVSDMFYPWTVDIADELKVPRILLYPSNSFFHCVSRRLRLHTPHEKVESESEDFLVPGLPDEIYMSRSELPDHLKAKTMYGDLIEEIMATESRSYGIILTSFYELEPSYSNLFKQIVKEKCWNLGPLSLFTNRAATTSVVAAGEESHHCLRWLDTHEPNSVIYVCFGSMVIFSDEQLTELALGLEASGHPFVWVVRRPAAESDAGEQWLPLDYEERVVKSNKGLILRGWAPQLQILDHPALGGFLNHSGWNSLLESITAGIPIVSWPLFAEHFFNSKLATQVLKIGVEIGPRVWNSGFEIKSPVVGRDEIEKSVRTLMGDSEDAKEMRRRAKEIQVASRRSVEEGGSSYSDLTNLVQELKAAN